MSCWAHLFLGHARERVALEAAAAREVLAADTEARAAAMLAEVEAAEAAGGIASLIGPEEVEALNCLGQQLQAAKAAQQAAEAAAEECELAMDAAEARAEAAEDRAVDMEKQLRDARAAAAAAAAARAAPAAPTLTDNAGTGTMNSVTESALRAAAGGDAVVAEGTLTSAAVATNDLNPAAKERRARQVLAKKSMLVHVRLLLSEMTADLREPAASLSPQAQLVPRAATPSCSPRMPS